MAESIKGMYTRMVTDRESYLQRARNSSKLTIPTLVPDEGTTAHLKFPTPYQSIGARGVNNLASALLMSLLPPNAPFFRLILDERERMKMDAIDPSLKNNIDRAMSDIERALMRELEINSIRVGTFEALKQLIVAGNVLLHIPEEGTMRVIRLENYAISRDAQGMPLKMIIKDTISTDTMSDSLREAAAAKMTAGKNTVDIYTLIRCIPKNKVEVYQEIEGVILEDSHAIYDKEKSPFIPLRMMRVDGEDYGRGYIEQYLGDLKSLEALTQAIVEGSAAASKVLFLVNPNGTTRAKTLAQSPNGAIREGNANDVSVLQTQKHADFSIALSTMQAIQERLSFAFLLTESTIRNADRVTAEEVRLVTQSIERQLGGIYSVLSQEFQLPLINRFMGRMVKSKSMPKIPKDLVVPTIVTGIEALGRGNDLNKLDIYLQGVAQTLGPDILGTYLDFREYLERRASALGIDTEGLIKSEEQIMQEQQQQQMQAAAMQAMPQLMQQGQQMQEEVSG